MKLTKPLLGIGIALGLFAPSALACHTHGTANAGQPAHNHHAIGTAKGTVGGINGNQVAVNHGDAKNKKTLNATVGNNTKITVPSSHTVTDKQGHSHVVTTEQPGTLSDLKDNQEVLVKYDETDGTALSIEVLPPA